MHEGIRMDDIGVAARTHSHNCARKFADIVPHDERRKGTEEERA